MAVTPKILAQYEKKFGNLNLDESISETKDYILKPGKNWGAGKGLTIFKKTEIGLEPVVLNHGRYHDNFNTAISIGGINYKRCSNCRPLDSNNRFAVLYRSDDQKKMAVYVYDFIEGDQLRLIGSHVFVTLPEDTYPGRAAENRPKYDYSTSFSDRRFMGCTISIRNGKIIIGLKSRYLQWGAKPVYQYPDRAPSYNNPVKYYEWDPKTYYFEYKFYAGDLTQSKISLKNPWNPPAENTPYDNGAGENKNYSLPITMFYSDTGAYIGKLNTRSGGNKTLYNVDMSTITYQSKKTATFNVPNSSYTHLDGWLPETIGWAEERDGGPDIHFAEGAHMMYSNTSGGNTNRLIISANSEGVVTTQTNVETGNGSALSWSRYPFRTNQHDDWFLLCTNRRWGFTRIKLTSDLKETVIFTKNYGGSNQSFFPLKNFAICGYRTYQYILEEIPEGLEYSLNYDTLATIQNDSFTDIQLTSVMIQNSSQTVNSPIGLYLDGVKIYTIAGSADIFEWGYSSTYYTHPRDAKKDTALYTFTHYPIIISRGSKLEFREENQVNTYILTAFGLEEG